MAKYKVCYEGWYIIEADSIEEALETDRDNAEVEYEEWENTEADEAIAWAEKHNFMERVR